MARIWESQGTVDPIDGAEVVVGVAAALIESQQGRVFECEHRKSRHQGVVQGDFHLARAEVGERAEMGAENLEEGVGREILPSFTGAAGAMASHLVSQMIR